MKHARTLPTLALVACVLSFALAPWGCGGEAMPTPPAAQMAFRYAPERLRLAAQSLELPSRFVGSLPFVECSLDGLEPRWFLLDTGHEANVVDTRLAAQLNVLELADKATVTAASGEERVLGSGVALERVRIGGLELLGIDALVDDLGAISRSVEVELGGILGYSAFNVLALTIDYPAQRIAVALEKLVAGEPDVVALVPDETLPWLESSVCGSATRLLIDSGSNEYLAVEHGVAAAAPWAFGPRPFARAMTAAGESTRLEYGRLGCDVALGRHVLARPIAAVSLADGRIGGRLLEAFRLTLDTRTSLARFERAATTPIESPPWHAHGAGWRTVDGRTVVLDLVPDSPAEILGLELGDEILFHGTGLIDETGACGEPHRLAPEFDGELLCIRRGEELLHLRLPNVDLVH